MKELSPGALDWLNSSPIEPCFLIEIELDEVMRLSTRQRYEVDGLVFEPGRVQGLRVAQSEVSFGLINEDYRYTAGALQGVYHRRSVRVWWVEGFELQQLIDPGYVEEGYYTERSAPTLIFQGEISRFSQITSVLGVVATRMAARRFPALQVYPPIANWVAPSGTTLSVGGNILTVRSRKD